MANENYLQAHAENFGAHHCGAVHFLVIFPVFSIRFFQRFIHIDLSLGVSIKNTICFMSVSSALLWKFIHFVLLYINWMQYSIWLEIAHWIQHCDFLSIHWHRQLLRGVRCCFVLLYGNLFGNNSLHLWHWILCEQFWRRSYSWPRQIIGTHENRKNVQRNGSVSRWNTRVTSILETFFSECRYFVSLWFK